jgi:hypothetical protein
MTKPAFWLWMLFWSVFTGAAITALLVALPQATALYYLAAAVGCGLIAVPCSRAASKSLTA